MMEKSIHILFENAEQLLEGEIGKIIDKMKGSEKAKKRARRQAAAGIRFGRKIAQATRKVKDKIKKDEE